MDDVINIDGDQLVRRRDPALDEVIRYADASMLERFTHRIREGLRPRLAAAVVREERGREEAER